MFTEKELRYLQDTDFLLTKQTVTQTLQSSFEEVKEMLEPLAQGLKEHFPPETDITLGKISKGEQYRGLPYMVLDFPRYLTRASLFSFRTLFWWGHAFSCHLLLGGDFWEKNRENVLKKAVSGQLGSAYICIAETPWEHHFGEDNYRKVESFTPEEWEHLIQGHAFFKAAQKLPIEEYQQLPQFTSEHFQSFVKLLM